MGHVSKSDGAAAPQHVLILGATSTIAAEVAVLYARAGNRLHLVGRNAEKLSALAARCTEESAGTARHAEITTQQADFGELDDNETVVALALEALGRVDVALIAHGELGDQLATERTFREAEHTLRVNFTSVVSLLVPLANHLEAARAGRIAVITSVAGDRGRPRNYTYGAAKGALNVYLQGMRSRLYAAGVQVVTLKLGPVDTPMSSGHKKHALFGKPLGVARDIVAAIEAGVPEAYVPSFWAVIMPIVKGTPERLFQRIGFLSGRLPQRLRRSAALYVRRRRLLPAGTTDAPLACMGRFCWVTGVLVATARIVPAALIPGCGGEVAGTASAGTVGGGAGASAAGGTAGSGGSGGTVGAPLMGAEGPSCAGGLVCAGKSCCENVLVPGGSFHFTAADGKTGPPQPDTVIQSFRLDTFPVTVGRYRAFVEAYDAWSKPVEGDGQNPAVPCDDDQCQGGQSGWQAGWNDYLPATAADLRAKAAACKENSSWTDLPGGGETRPIGCLGWFEAYAFCLWDGGRLPFASEWTYAAAGGEENRAYPWGEDAPDATRYGSTCDDFSNLCTLACPAPHDEVGAYPAGAARWGHLDLIGLLRQWTRDSGFCAMSAGPWWSAFPEHACLRFHEENVPTDASRTLCGGGASCDPLELQTSHIHATVPFIQTWSPGVRCARQP